MPLVCFVLSGCPCSFYSPYFYGGYDWYHWYYGGFGNYYYSWYNNWYSWYNNAYGYANHQFGGVNYNYYNGYEYEYDSYTVYAEISVCSPSHTLTYNTVSTFWRHINIFIGDTLATHWRHIVATSATHHWVEVH